MSKVTIYSTPTCHFCHMAKDFFTAKGIPYEDFDVSFNMEKRKEMMDKSGQMGVPVITIPGNGSVTVTLVNGTLPVLVIAKL